MQRFYRVVVFVSLVVCISPLLALSQGIQQSPYSAADAVRRNIPSIAADLTPSNPLGLPGSSAVGLRGSDTISISSGMFQGILPTIPNLQLGYNYTFGPRFRTGTASIDYLVPFKLGGDSTVYGEAHGEFQSLSIAQPGSPNNSVELCLGGGYRRMFGSHTMLGVHSFFDTTKLYGVWYSSGSVGAEMAALVAGHDAIDLNFNWYGKSAGASSLSNSLGYNPATGGDGFGNANFDFQAGYSHELYDGGPDLRLSITGYKFDADSDVYGYYAGAELKSRDGVFVVKYDVGYDNTNQTYQSVGAFMNIGFQLENLVAGTSPFVMPKPVFQSPRAMTRLTEAKVTRNWRRTTQTAQIALLSASCNPCGVCNPNPPTDCPLQTVTVKNATNVQQTLYMGFLLNCTCDPRCDVLGGYNLPTDFNTGTTTWAVTSNPLILTTTIGAKGGPNDTIVIPFKARNRRKVSIVISANTVPWTNCAVTMAEFTLGDNWGQYGGLRDTYDLSLVNGFNVPMKITPDQGTEIAVTALASNENNLGVYPFACTNCTWGADNAECKNQPGAWNNPPLVNPTPTTNYPGCKTGGQVREPNPDVKCQLSQASINNYVVTIGP
jgi:hypothetical protein